MKMVFYWVGGREVGAWFTVHPGPGNRALGIPDTTVDSVLAECGRMGYVAEAGDVAPVGPPSDARFRALGL